MPGKAGVKNPIDSSRLSSNFACATAMILWAIGFPAAEILLQSWGAVSLVALRQLASVFVLILIWLWLEGWQTIVNAPWKRGLGVGGLGFGFGAILLLVGQQLSDPVTPALAAAMMPIAGTALEIAFDDRKLTPRLTLGIALALLGGYLATGVNLNDGNFGLGAILCMIAVFLFAWATRSTTRDFQSLSSLGQTSVTLVGGMVFMFCTYFVIVLTGYQGAEIGIIDQNHILMFLVFSIVSLSIAQSLWIWGAGGLGIMLASFHLNAVPFYVMVAVVVFLDGQWNSYQAIGAAIVAIGVIIAQTSKVKIES